MQNTHKPMTKAELLGCEGIEFFGDGNDLELVYFYWPGGPRPVNMLMAKIKVVMYHKDKLDLRLKVKGQRGFYRYVIYKENVTQSTIDALCDLCALGKKVAIFLPVNNDEDEQV